ncbi:MAG: branched-chain amino acid ABC transporter permease [Chloroflexi bacterium]|nr:branched-chain amino acid ABC transporter permease [Chloroflexota bacterium]MBM3174937.1 branched-chain amino acid ABC transporter permease [Chloroflexota bacterium]
MILQVTLNGMTMGLTYVLIALGFCLVFGIARIFNFAHGEMYMLGGWGIVLLFGQLGLNYGMALLISALSIGLIGILLDRFFFRPFRGQTIPPMVVALGLQLLLSALAMLAFGEKPVSVQSPFTGITKIGDSVISNERLAVTLTSIAMVAFVYIFVRTTKLGLAMRAIPQNMEGAVLLGVNINRVSYLAFFVGALLAGAAGGLLGPLFYVSSFLGPWAVFKAIIVVALGGAGSIGGTIIAGLLVGFVEAFTQHFFGGGVAEIGGFVLIIIVLLLRPRGLFGHEVV